MIASVIANVSGKALKKSVKVSDFLPHYIKEQKKANTDKSLKEQEEEMKAFAAKLKSMTGQKG